MIIPDAPILDILDEDFVDERQKSLALVYRSLNTIQTIFDAEFHSGNLSKHNKQKADFYIRSLRAMNLILDILANKDNNA